MKKTRKRFLQTEFIRFLKERKNSEFPVDNEIDDDFPLDNIDDEGELDEVETDETDLYTDFVEYFKNKEKSNDRYN
ncbi:MAG: hypothetical protein B7C24_08155 [Bacteroidetes bacterium 4572_77]|nr:MAG: hypothetical protein B7C24_08155 [Bacteroidetes bacterium 4572_77]